MAESLTMCACGARRVWVRILNLNHRTQFCPAWKISEGSRVTDEDLARLRRPMDGSASIAAEARRINCPEMAKKYDEEVASWSRILAACERDRARSDAVKIETADGDVDIGDPVWDAYSLEAIAIHGRAGLSDDHVVALRRAAAKLRAMSAAQRETDDAGDVLTRDLCDVALVLRDKKMPIEASVVDRAIAALTSPRETIDAGDMDGFIDALESRPTLDDVVADMTRSLSSAPRVEGVTNE